MTRVACDPNGSPRRSRDLWGDGTPLHIEQRTPVSSLPGASASVLAESARERAWAEFVVGKREPAVAPVVLGSWLRSRDVFHVDPALERSPIVLAEDEWCQRREQMESMGAGVGGHDPFGP